MPSATTSIHSWILIASAGLLACGGVADDPSLDPDAGGDSDAGDGDIVAPTVVSVSPPDGAIGVTADAELELVFSEPMNRAAVEAAWTSAELPALAVAFEWNDASDTLTVIPAEPLALAEGTGLDPSTVAPFVFALEVGVGAQDLAGNPLTAAVSTSFSTQRRMQVDLAVIPVLTRTMRSDGLVFGETAVSLAVGDNASNEQTKVFASFEVPDLPAGAAIERATFEGNQSSTNATPFVLGDLAAFHVNGAVIDADMFDNSLSEIGDFSTDIAPGPREIDVTAELADDLANRATRGDRTQYKLQFPNATNNNGVTDDARYNRSGFGLSVVYLAD